MLLIYCRIFPDKVSHYVYKGNLQFKASALHCFPKSKVSQ